MAHHKAALKSIRQDKKRTARNRHYTSAMRTYIKKVLTALEDKKVDEAKTNLQKAHSIIDRAVTKGVIHRNAADRYKSRLALKVAQA